MSWRQETPTNPDRWWGKSQPKSLDNVTGETDEVIDVREHKDQVTKERGVTCPVPFVLQAHNKFNLITLRWLHKETVGEEPLFG